MTDLSPIRVGDLVRRGALEISDGYRVRNEELGADGIPFVRGGDIKDGSIDTDTVDRIRPELADRIRSKLARHGDVAFITKGTVGRVGRLRATQPSVVFAPQVAYWRVVDPDVIDPTFLYYLLRGQVFQGELNAVKTHGAMVADYVSLSQQLDFRLPIPSIKYQRGAAHLLEPLDDKIDLLRRMNQTLEETARALFKSWFVRSLGANAEHTSIQTLVDARVLQIGDGYRAKLSEMASEGIPFARAGNVNNGFRFGDQDLLGEEAIRTAGDKVSEPWDVVFTSKGTVGRFAVVYPTTRRFVYSPQLCFWRSLDHERLNPIFLLCWMRSSAFLDQVAAVSGQTDMALYVNLRDQRRMRMTLPSPAAQRELDHSLRPVVNRVELNERQVTTLAEARDTLLPKLLSGSLRIPEVERFLSSEVR
jgi:type I restriction enzyme, S subunit